MALRSRDRHVFMWQSVKILNVFNTWTLKQSFWKRKFFFKKLDYGFLVESTNVENTFFLYKTAISEAYVRTNTKVTTKCTHHKERSFASNYFIFLKIWFQFNFCNSLYKELIWCTNNPSAHIRTFCQRWSLIWRWFSPVSILKSIAELQTWLLFMSGTWKHLSRFQFNKQRTVIRIFGKEQTANVYDKLLLQETRVL